MIATPLLLLLPLPTPQAQTPVAVLRRGETLANGDQVQGFTHLRVNDLGQWAAIVTTDNPNPAQDEQLLVNGVTVAREGQPAPGAPAQTILDLVDIDLTDDGHLITVLEATGGFIVYRDATLILRENDAATAPGFGLNAQFIEVFKANGNAQGQVLLRCRVADAASTPNPASCLVRLDLGPAGAVLSQSLYARSGDVFPGLGDPLAAVSRDDNAVSFGDTAQGTWSGRLVPAATPGVEFAYRNSNTLLVQGGQAFGATGRTFADVPFEATALSPNGVAALAALLDPSNTDNDEVIFRNGNVYVRENLPFPGLPGAPTVTEVSLSKLFLTDGDEVCCFIETGTGGGLVQYILRGNTVMLRTGDTLFSGQPIGALTGAEHGFHVSDNGEYLLATAILPNAEVALVYVQMTLGANYCAAQTNSTGLRAITTARGASLAHLNGLRLVTSDAPPTSFAYYIASRTQGDVLFPGGSSGRICVAGSVGRFITQVGQVSASGSFAIVPNLAAMPTTPNVAVQPGETWNFQLWFRDAGPTGPTSNFSLPVSVEFH